MDSAFLLQKMVELQGEMKTEKQETLTSLSLYLEHIKDNKNIKDQNI